MDDYQHRVSMQVRDYELDYQQVVNHATYINYYEHARTDFLATHDLDSVVLQQQGYSLMLTELTVTYKRSLTRSQSFMIYSKFSLKAKRMIIAEQALMVDDVCYSTLHAKVICIDQRTQSLCMPDCMLEKIFSD